VLGNIDSAHLLRSNALYFFVAFALLTAGLLTSDEINWYLLGRFLGLLWKAVIHKWALPWQNRFAQGGPCCVLWNSTLIASVSFAAFLVSAIG
jgi:hypothetical protein